MMKKRNFLLGSFAIIFLVFPAIVFSHTGEKHEEVKKVIIGKKEKKVKVVKEKHNEEEKSQEVNELKEKIKELNEKIEELKIEKDKKEIQKEVKKNDLYAIIKISALLLFVLGLIIAYFPVKETS